MSLPASSKCANPVWLDSLWLGHRTCDSKVVSSIPGRRTIARLVLGWVTVFGRAYHLDSNLPPRPTQPPALRGTGNGYRPQCGDAQRLGIKGTMARSIRESACGWQVQLCDPLLTFIVLGDKAIYKRPVLILVITPSVYRTRLLFMVTVINWQKVIMAESLEDGGR